MLGLYKHLLGLTDSYFLSYAFIPHYDPIPKPRLLRHEAASIKWSTDETRGHGLYQIASDQTQVYAGHAHRFSRATEGRVHIASPKFIALTVTPLDWTQWPPPGGAHRRPARTLLVTACGRCENTNMQFSKDRRTVGRHWGQAPVRIEAVQGELTLPEGRWTCQALAPDGSPKQAVPIAYDQGRGILEMSPKYETMWYLLERQAP